MEVVSAMKRLMHLGAERQEKLRPTLAGKPPRGILFTIMEILFLKFLL